ncbi:hypothetical protein DYB28_004899, partial [Aphanomyces astaci]
VAQRLERVKQLGTGRVPGRVEIKNLLQLSHRWLVVTNEGPREAPYFGRTRGSEVLRLLHRRDDGARLPTVAKRWCLARRAAATAAARRIATVSPNERGTDDGLRDDDGGDDGDYDDNAEIKDADDNQAPQRLGDTDSSDDDVEDNAPQPKRAKTTSTHINFGNIVVRRYDPSRNIPIETYLRDFDRVTRTYAAVNGARWTDEALGAFLYEKLEGDAALWATVQFVKKGHFGRSCFGLFRQGSVVGIPLDDLRPLAYTLWKTDFLSQTTSRDLPVLYSAPDYVPQGNRIDALIISKMYLELDQVEHSEVYVVDPTLAEIDRDARRAEIKAHTTAIQREIITREVTKKLANQRSAAHTFLVSAISSNPTAGSVANQARSPASRLNIAGMIYRKVGSTGGRERSEPGRGAPLLS